MSLKRFILFFVFILPLYVMAESWSDVQLKKTGTITVFYYNSDNFISDASGEIKGIEYDLFMEFQKYIRSKGIDLTIAFKKSDSFFGLYEEIKHGANGEFGACSFSITDQRKQEVAFSPKYMPDIEVLINSSNVPIAKNQAEFNAIFSQLTALNVPNTTYEEDLKKLRDINLNFTIENVTQSSIIKDRILSEPDLFGYIELPTYLKLFKEGKRVKRQNLFKVERSGYGIILPLNSDWVEPINDFFSSTDFKLTMNKIIKEHFGNDVNELLWKIDAPDNQDNNHQEISLLTLERELQEKEINQQQFKLQLLIIGVIVVFIIAFLLFYAYRIKKTINDSLVKQNEKIAQQKDELERLSLVASNTSNGVVILDAYNKTEWINKSYASITGYQLDELIGISPADLLVFDESDKQTIEKIKRSSPNKKPWRERILVLNKRKEKIWLEINNTPVIDDDGIVTKYIEIIDDVTQKVKNETALTRLSIVAEKMNEAVLIADAKGKIEYYNDSLVRNSGYSKEEFVKTFGDTFYLQQITSRNDLDEVIEGFNTSSDPFFYDSPHTKKDGSVMWTTSSLSPVYDDHKRLTKIIVVYTDINERKLFVNQLSEKNKEILDSINYAKMIQDALLPSSNVLKNGFEDYFILFKPKDIVSGDFYWFDQIRDYMIVLLADCTGHGVPGAFMSMMGSNFLSHIVLDNAITSTSAALNVLDSKVKKALSNDKHSSNDGMDIVMMAFNLKNKVLDFSGGMNSIFVFRNGELTRYKGDRFSIGDDGKENKQFNEHQIQLQKGDIVYTFTDGYQDQFGGEKGKKFMQKRLLNLLIQHASEPLEKQKEILDDHLKKWMKGYDQVDDISVLGFKVG